MRSHFHDLIPRMIRAGLRVRECRYRVIAAGLDYKNRIISIATNTPHLPMRGRHAEERVMFNTPRIAAENIDYESRGKGRNAQN